MSFEIKNLTDCPEHLPLLAQWHFEQWGASVPGGCTVERYIRKLGETMGDDAFERTFVAVRDAKPLGSASLVRHDMSTRMDLEPWLASVYTNPACRREGIGRAVVRAVMDYTATIGVAVFYLYTPDRREFYEHLGWTWIESPVYRGEIQHVMSYRFDAAK